jgi:hypothetical protein
MARWYSKITTSNDYFGAIGDAIEYFYAEYEVAHEELRPKRGSSMTDTSLRIPGMVEYRYGQLQELEAILKFLEIKYDMAYGDHKRLFFEHYNRQLSEKQAGERANIEPDVVILREFIQQVSLIRNLFIAVTKGLEALHFQMGHIVKLKQAGLEDATF